MSVTFSAEYRESDVVGFHITSVCGCTGLAHSTYDEAEAAYRELPGSESGEPHLPECSMDPRDWAIYRPSIEAIEIHDRPEMNVSNTNARGLLELLGLDVEDMSGEVDAKGLVGRILMAQALASGDVGRPAISESSEGSPTMIDCGRSVGYYDSRLTELAEIARWSAEHDRLVVWF